ncbi:MAG: class I SAM-dependent methyltransferase [Myxococcota bacterium]
MRGVEQIPWLYDALLAVGEATGLKSWREWLVRGARGWVLDLGCGTGRNLPLFSRDTHSVGVDPCHQTLLKAKKRAPGIPLVRASAEALPFKPGIFDTVVSGLVFCSVPNPLKGLAEVKRVLAPSGELRMLEHVRSTTRLGAKWQDFIQPAWTAVAGGCHPNRDTEANVRAAGFLIDEKSARAEKNLRRFLARPS